MRLAPFVLVSSLSVACLPPGGARDAEDEKPARASHTDVEAARELDQAGVRRFKEGRWADAARYFRAAYRLGGPSSELWNLARCQEREDDPEAAARTLEVYLALRDLPAADRAEAEREAQALRARPSLVTVTTTPPGASVVLDGKPTGGQTPVTFEVPPGAHAVTLRHDGFAAQTRPLEARFGRAVIVVTTLAREGK